MTAREILKELFGNGYDWGYHGKPNPKEAIEKALKDLHYLITAHPNMQKEKINLYPIVMMPTKRDMMIAEYVLKQANKAIAEILGG